MTDNFFGKTLAVRKIDAISGMLEFDIPVHGDNRGWFKENFQKEKMVPLAFLKASLLKGNCKITSAFLAKMFFEASMLSLGTSTSLLQIMGRF